MMQQLMEALVQMSSRGDPGPHNRLKSELLDKGISQLDQPRALLEN